MSVQFALTEIAQSVLLNFLRQVLQPSCSVLVVSGYWHVRRRRYERLVQVKLTFFIYWGSLSRIRSTLIIVGLIRLSLLFYTTLVELVATTIEDKRLDLQILNVWIKGEAKVDCH